MANRNRTAGLNWERKCIKFLKAILGNDNIGSTRQHNRELDAKGVDIVGINGYDLGFYVQCKTLCKMPSGKAIKEIFAKMPKDKEKYILLQLTKKVNKRFVSTDSIIIKNTDESIKNNK